MSGGDQGVPPSTPKPGIHDGQKIGYVMSPAEKEIDLKIEMSVSKIKEMKKMLGMMGHHH